MGEIKERAVGKYAAVNDVAIRAVKYSVVTSRAGVERRAGRRGRLRGGEHGRAERGGGGGFKDPSCSRETLMARRENGAAVTFTETCRNSPNRTKIPTNDAGVWMENGEGESPPLFYMLL